MADIFISYARQDIDKARAIAKELEACGWSVFWDRHIPHGQDFNAFLQKQIDAAHCIMVLWSQASIASQFVRDEAAEGLDGRLVPVLIEPVKQPLGFRQLQAADLTAANDLAQQEDFKQLVRSIADKLSPPDGKTPRPAGDSTATGETARKGEPGRRPGLRPIVSRTPWIAAVLVAAVAVFAVPSLLKRATEGLHVEPNAPKEQVEPNGPKDEPHVVINSPGDVEQQLHPYLQIQGDRAAVIFRNSTSRGLKVSICVVAVVQVSVKKEFFGEDYMENENIRFGTKCAAGISPQSAFSCFIGQNEKLKGKHAVLRLQFSSLIGAECPASPSTS